MLESVVNISEGRDGAVLEALTLAAGRHLLDLHVDPWHHRAVLTLAGDGVEGAVRAVATAAVERVDLRTHVGVHPRLGAVDVVPFVPLTDSSLDDAIAARNAFARWMADELDVPCFLYGPDRSLPDVRRRAFAHLPPDTGTTAPHPTAGASCVGARPVLIAYNLWLAVPDLQWARSVARSIRTPSLRTLGLAVGDHVQVSCNLIECDSVGPADAFDAVSAFTEVARAELVGLVPRRVLDRTPTSRWPQLDLDDAKTIEARLEQAGLDGGSGG
ncbi:MAG TPA: hypothetical protein VMY34_01170 [Acidimicrobiales bacterium]|nr:hypothetical protein [Acidimicrobiales bacterium]